MMIVGGGVMLMLFIPNPWQGRLTILAAATMISTIGILLYYSGRRSKAQVEKTRL